MILLMLSLASRIGRCHCSVWRALRLAGRKGGRIEGERGRRKEEGHTALLLSAACLYFMLPNVVIFFFNPSASLDVAREQFQDHSNTDGEKILNQCFQHLRLGVGTGGGHQETSHSIQPPSPFIFLSPLLSSRLPLLLPSRHCLPLSLSHLACLKI